MKFIDMFCGIGGFRYGLEKASSQSHKGQYKATDTRSRHSVDLRRNGGQTGYQCVWSNDNDKYACQIYRQHFGEVTEADIRTVDADAIPEHDLLCAGFPCQSFSIAGKRRGFEDTRGTLFFEICRVLRAKRPGMLFLENVKGLLSADEGRTFLTIIQSLDELGYDCQWQVLNSKDYGVPQNRERVFIIGHLRGTPRPKVFPLGEGNARVMGEREADEGKEDITRALRGRDCKDGTNFVMHNLQKRDANRPSLTRLCDCGSGKLYKQCCGVDGGSGHLSRQDGTTYCLDEGSQQAIELAGSIRRLTPIECERLQGFPDNWTKSISDSQRYKCLGNAVTTTVITAIGERLF